MKKICILFCSLLACVFTASAQQFVSTTPTNRNVVIEEFTGRNCGFCPDGHVVANNICNANPGRAWAINIHAGGFSPTTYPNFQCPDGVSIHNGFSINGYPSGAVNRQGSTAIGRGQWASAASSQLGQPSEVNIGGQVVINEASRTATITVEVYYTADAPTATNQLTVVMLQDSIMGSQSGMSSNPAQVVNGQYCHMHILRDVVNSTSPWGEVISPTTAGTLITKEYVYDIPEVIGNPNGVDVILDHLHFLAMVTKDNYYVLSANNLDVVFRVDEPIYPVIKNVSQENIISCQNSKHFNLAVMNAGLDEITSLTFEAVVEGQTFTETWNGSLPSLENMNFGMDVDIPFGEHQVDFSITSANGTAFEAGKSINAVCEEWGVVEVDGAEETLEINVWQDRFGNQITWELLGSDLSVLASGGPYTMYFQDTALLHTHHATVPVNECVKFVIYDAVGNGICCQFGNGHYNIKDSAGNVVVEGDGMFTYEQSSIISLMGEGYVAVNTTEVVDVNYNAATFRGKVTAGTAEVVGFEYRKVSASAVTEVEATLDGSVFTATVTDLEPSSIYMVRAFAESKGTRFYGQELTFQTWTTGVDEASNAWNVYPNPASSLVNIEGEKMQRVEVYNAVGQVVVAQEVSDNAVQLNAKEWSNGVYFVRIYSESGQVVNKKVTVSK